VAKTTTEGFPRKNRIVRTSDYRALYTGGRKIYSERFVLFGRENGLNCHRLGITVSKKVGNAVVRNRVKRLFREIFRKSCFEIPGFLDFVVNAKSGCAEANYNELRAEFLSAARRICR
jgi:ribonuclease P protein component